MLARGPIRKLLNVMLFAGLRLRVVIDPTEREDVG